MEPKASEVPTEEAYRRGWIDGHSAAHKSERAAIVAWLRKDNGQCDCHARAATECACGAWDDYKTRSLLDIASDIERGDHVKHSHPTPDAV